MEDLREYIKPPSYEESIKPPSDNKLISKLQLRINQDLNQINGVYDSQISDVVSNMTKRIEEIKKESQKEIEEINFSRKKQIEMYNDNAEKHIDQLLVSIGKSEVNKGGMISWIKSLF